MWRAQRRSTTDAAVALIALLLAGCGGSGGVEGAADDIRTGTAMESAGAVTASSTTPVATTPRAEASSTTAPGTTSLVISTTTRAVPDEQALQALAATGAGRPEDLGAGWTALSDAQPMEDPRRDECALLVPGPLAELHGVAVHSGPVLRHDASGFTAVTIAYAFEDAVQAGRWLAVSRDPAYIECDRARIEAFQQAALPGVRVALSDRNASLATSEDFSVARDVLAGSGAAIGMNDRRHYLVSNVVMVQVSALVGPLDGQSAGMIAVQLRDGLERAAARVRDQG